MKKNWILLLLTALFIYVIVTRYKELVQLKTTVAQGQLWLVVAAMLVQLVYYVAFSWSYQSAFDTVEIETRTRDLIPVMLGSLFVNVVVPAGGAGGMALFTEDLARRGKPVARSAAGMLLQVISDFTAFTLALIPGLVFLFTKHDLKSYEIVTAIIMILITAGLSSILLIGIWRPGWLHRLFGWSRRTANWIFGRLNRSLALAEDWEEKNADEFGEASKAVASHPWRLLRTVGAALLAHLLDILTLYLIFRAFNQPVHLGVLLAGYGIGILFWVISITPQGIGVVEGMMTLTLSSLGIPTAVAATVALVFRGLTFWTPMVLGFFAIQRLRTFKPNRRTLTETWGVRFAAILVALMGVVNLLSAVTPSLADRMRALETFSPLMVVRGGHLTAALGGFALLALSLSLLRRKYVAWLLTILTLAVSIISHLIKGLDYEEALLAAALMVMLILMRRHFYARSDRPSVRQGLLMLVRALIFTLAYGVAGFYLLDRHYSVNFGFWAALRQTVVMFTQFYDPGLTPTTHFGRFFAGSIYVIGASTFGFALFMLLRPVFLRDETTDADRERAKKIVENYGRSSLARCLLFDDKCYFFTPGGSVIGYAMAGRTAVALGDPVGPGEDLLPAIQAFQELCKRNDWMPVFYQTLPDTLQAYKTAGFDAISAGEEGVVELATFSIEGKEGKPMRNALNKLTKAGHNFQVYDPPITDELLDELRSISEEWLTMMHGSEKSFSLGWFDDEYIRTSPIAVVQTQEGWISAFANLVPEYQLNECTIDLMRRRKEIENGTMDFLFVSLFQWAKEKGYDGFNLGLSALYGVGEHSDDPVVEKAMHYIYEHVDQFYNFKGLHEFKEKFHPLWSPRYLIYPGTANLMQSWVAVTQANSGRGGLLRGVILGK